MSTYLGELQCLRCGSVQPESQASFGCPECRAGGVAVNVLPRYRTPHERGLQRQEGQPGLFRFRPHLPLGEDVVPVSLGEGGTPLLPLPRLAAELGLGALHLKDESQNPTWSYKDRLAAVAITKAREQGVERVVVSSTGNAGAATAAYAAAAGMTCIALTIASVPTTMKVLMQSFTPHVVALADPDDRWRLMRRLVEERGWTATSGFSSPPVGSNAFGVDGYKTLAYELVEQLGHAPSAVVTPVAYGDAVAGIHRGFRDLRELGVIDRVPRLIAVDPLGAYAAALAGDDDVTVEDRDSVAFSVSVISATRQALWAIRDSGGDAVVGGSDAAILQAQQRLARSTGVFAEASAAMVLAVLPGLRARGVLGAGDEVVMLNTSTGLKDVGATASLMAPVPVIAPTLDALDAALGLEEAR